ncbi:MAG: DNA repair protein RecN [Verrucomicrobiales bacterium]|nr:DNA repair protein RecN [Verrucomicrobiales bacterium]
MLTTLTIKNLALVESLTWEVGPGLVCVTGETGAGKSIIVGALKLILGERADRDLIRTGTDTCSVEAVFHLEKPAEVNAALEEAGLEPCEGAALILKRVIATGGQNRQFVNCAPATLHVLKVLGQFLVDLHGPHDHQSLLSRDRQLAMLDAAADAAQEADACRDAFRKWRGIATELDDLTHAEKTSEQELDLLRFQVEEIDAAALRPEEEEALLQRYKMASNATRLAELAGQVLGELSDADDSVLNRLGEIRRLLRDLEKTDSGAAQWTGGFETAVVELEEIERSLRHYSEGLEFDPREISSLEERINTLESLKRKYGGTLQRVLEHREAAAARLGKSEGRTEELLRLQQALAAAREVLDAAASKLSQLRRRAAPRLAREVSRHLGDLGFRQSRFSVELAALSQPAASGMEEVEFMIAPNPGEPAKPLRQIASSGEMSRVMLAVKSALAREDAIPLLVFDEIDANVGGEIAAAVGRKMQSLGATHQVISITHLPQVAALATCHCVVSKEVEKDRTFSRLTQVRAEDRVEEIARMLGGKAASARAHARSLLAETP